MRDRVATPGPGTSPGWSPSRRSPPSRRISNSARTPVVSASFERMADPRRSGHVAPTPSSALGTDAGYRSVYGPLPSSKPASRVRTRSRRQRRSDFYGLSWGLIDEGSGGAGRAARAVTTVTASHFTHGTNQLSAYAGIGVRLARPDQCCSRPSVRHWKGFDILPPFDTQLDQGLGTASAEWRSRKADSAHRSQRRWALSHPAAQPVNPSGSLA
jgi:hypothetical protein